MTAVRIPSPPVLAPEARASGPIKAALIVASIAAVMVLAIAGTSLVGVVLVAAVVVLAIGAVYALDTPQALLPLSVYTMWFEGVGAGPITTGRVVAGMVPLVLGARVLTTSWRPPALAMRAWAPVAALLIWAWMGAFYSDNFTGGWLQGYLILMLGVVYYVVFAIFTESPFQLAGILRGWIWVGAFASIASDVAHFGFGYRTSGFTGNPNLFANYLVAGFPIIVVLFRRSTSSLERWGLALCVPIYLSALIAAGSRMGLIMGAVMGAYMLVTLPGIPLRRRVATMAIGFPLMGFAGFLFTILNPERFSLAFLASDRGAGRIDLWNAGVSTLRDHLIVGRGLNGFRLEIFDLLQRTSGAQLNVLRQPEFLRPGEIESHNLYLTVAIDLGLIGFILYFGVVAVAIVNLWQKRKSEWSDWVWCFLGVIGALLVGSMFGSQINNKLQWAVVGIAAGFWVRERLTSPTVVVIGVDDGAR